MSSEVASISARLRLKGPTTAMLCLRLCGKVFASSGSFAAAKLRVTSSDHRYYFISTLPSALARRVAQHMISFGQGA